MLREASLDGAAITCSGLSMFPGVMVSSRTAGLTDFRQLRRR